MSGRSAGGQTGVTAPTTPGGCPNPAAPCDTVLGAAAETSLGLAGSICSPGSQRFVINPVT